MKRHWIAACGPAMLLAVGVAGQTSGIASMKRLDADVVPLPYCMVQEQTSVQQGPQGLLSTRTVEVRHCRDGQGRVRIDRLHHALRKVPDGPDVPVEERTVTVVDGPRGVAMNWGTYQGKTVYVSHFAAEAKHVEAWLRPQVPQSFGEQGQSKRSVEPLGRRVIQGVIVEGTRDAEDVPAGLRGNNLAYRALSEHWISVDFRVEVEGTMEDGFGARETTVLKGFTPGEPEASLFEVPTGYQVQDPQAIVRP